MPHDTTKGKLPEAIGTALKLLAVHRETFYAAARFAQETKHPVPSDTRAWSQILVSVLTGCPGIEGKKGADLADGSDVKGANVWLAIDTPRFNGVVKSGRKADRGSLDSLEGVPYLYFVMWDYEGDERRERCRVWAVRPAEDKVFRAMCNRWYQLRDAGEIGSNNFQLHPPRNRDSNIFRNKCGNLAYPLLFAASWSGTHYRVRCYAPEELKTGKCVRAREG